MLKRILLIVLLAASIAHADYLGRWAIDDYLPIPAAIHRFSTGLAYLPTTLTYSIYEDGNTTGLDEDVDMVPASPFDGKTGLYLVRRQLTTAAGFEAGKNYTVRVYVDVDSVTANQWHTFQIGNNIDDVNSVLDAGNDAIKGDTAAILVDTSAQDAASEWTSLMGGVALDDVNSVLDTVNDAILADTDPFDTAGERATAIWSAAAASYNVEDSFGNVINDVFSESGGTYYIDTIDEDTTTLDFDATDISASLDAGSVDDIWNELMSGHTTVGSAAAYLRSAAAERRP
jgi:hypothetical protein